MKQDNSTEILANAIDKLSEGFNRLPCADSAQSQDNEAVNQVLLSLAEKLHDNYPYHHPLYAGQMLKPPHKIARIAYQLALLVNPNNHALDGGRATSALEKECVKELANMFGFESYLGHLTSGGTMANLEALWVAGQIHPTKKIVASSQAHYTHSRITSVLQLKYESVAVDDSFRMDMTALGELLASGEVGTVVVTLGTTGVGAVDPLDKIVTLQEKYDFRIHVDAAYGGYFSLGNNLAPHVLNAFDSIMHVDSIVIDPHKHGLQPYGCGCIIYKDPSVGQIYKHDSPYTYFSSKDLHLGEISLECSRAGASAAALWATMQHLPLQKDGAFAQNLSLSPLAAQELYLRLEHSENHLTIVQPQLDIVVWAPKAAKVSEISALAQKHFEQAAEQDLHLALITLPKDIVKNHWVGVEWDEPSVVCLRSCLMKPEHLNWIERIWSIIESLEVK